MRPAAQRTIHPFDFCKSPFIVKKHIPNSITGCNLICGCIAIHYAMSGALTMALLFIVLGAVFDFFDGFAARLLGVAGPIGKELDSLADVVTFGVAPAAMVFTLLSQNSRCSANGSCPLAMILPYTAFLIAAFSALRLAKFNLDTRQSHSFIGLPTPANALFWGSLAVWLSETSIQVNLTVFRISMFLLIIWSCQIMVSEVPMFALKFKSYGWKGNGIRYSFMLLSLAVVITAAALGQLILAPAVIVLLYVLASLLTQRNNAA